MSEPQSIPSKFIACRLDMSEHFSPEFLDRYGGKIYLSGFYDDNLNTFICSAEKMIFVHALEYVPESCFYDPPTMEELLMEQPESAYFSRSHIERMRKQHPDCFQELDIEFDEHDPPEVIVLEHLQCNPVF